MQNIVIQTYTARHVTERWSFQGFSSTSELRRFEQLQNLRQSLCRETNFRNLLCYKMLTCVPKQKITIRVVILKLQVHHMGVKVDRNSIAKQGFANRIGFTSLDVNPEKLKSSPSKSGMLKYISKYVLLGPIMLLCL